jgi:hypothetical protein
VFPKKIGRPQRQIKERVKGTGSYYELGEAKQYELDTLVAVTLDELQREYAPLRQQADAVRSYL